MYTGLDVVSITVKRALSMQWYAHNLHILGYNIIYYYAWCGVRYLHAYSPSCCSCHIQVYMYIEVVSQSCDPVGLVQCISCVHVHSQSTSMCITYYVMILM